MISLQSILILFLSLLLGIYSGIFSCTQGGQDLSSTNAGSGNSSGGGSSGGLAPPTTPGTTETGYDNPQGRSEPNENGSLCLYYEPKEMGLMSEDRAVLKGLICKCPEGKETRSPGGIIFNGLEGVWVKARLNGGEWVLAVPNPTDSSGWFYVNPVGPSIEDPSLDIEASHPTIGKTLKVNLPIGVAQYPIKDHPPSPSANE